MQLQITPSYCARSAPVEVGWANTKNPISRVRTKSITELEQQLALVVGHKLTEEMWLGAYRTTRAWEDKMWVELNAHEQTESQQAMDVKVARESTVDDD